MFKYKLRKIIKKCLNINKENQTKQTKNEIES